MRLTQVAAAGPVLAVVAGVAAGISLGAGIGVAAAAGVAVAAGIVLWVERRRYRAWAYREREDDLIVSRGVLDGVVCQDGALTECTSIPPTTVNRTAQLTRK
jgi:membrane protein YdbS with pleckstrin-like domain